MTKMGPDSDEKTNVMVPVFEVSEGSGRLLQIEPPSHCVPALSYSLDSIPPFLLQDGVLLTDQSWADVVSRAAIASPSPFVIPTAPAAAAEASEA